MSNIRRHSEDLGFKADPLKILCEPEEFGFEDDTNGWISACLGQSSLTSLGGIFQPSTFK